MRRMLRDADMLVPFNNHLSLAMSEIIGRITACRDYSESVYEALK